MEEAVQCTATACYYCVTFLSSHLHHTLCKPHHEPALLHPVRMGSHMLVIPRNAASVPCK